MWVPPVSLAQQEAKDKPDRLVQLVPLDQLGSLVIQGVLDLQVLQDHQEQQEHLVHLGTREVLEPRGQLEHPVLREQSEQVV